MPNRTVDRYSHSQRSRRTALFTTQYPSDYHQRNRNHRLIFARFLVLGQGTIAWLELVLAFLRHHIGLH